MGEKRTYKLTINGCFVCIKKGISTSFVCMLTTDKVCRLRTWAMGRTDFRLIVTS